MSDEAVKTFTLPLAGRQVAFRRPSLGQTLVLQRLLMRAKSAESDEQSGGAYMDAIIKTLNFIDTLFVSPEDQVFIEEQMLAGNIDFKEVFVVLSGGSDETDTADDEAVKPAKRAPKKSPKAAPAARKVASSARTKR